MVSLTNPSKSKSTANKPLAEVSGSPFFSLVCYNILAESYARPRYYPWITSRRILSWNFRSQKILSEILSYDADVICLQEVENTAFEWMRKQLLLLGNYDEAHFLERTGWRIDGCAIFFRSTKFTCLGKMEILFNHLTDRDDLKTDNIALLLALQFVDQHASTSSSPFSSSSTSSVSASTSSLPFGDTTPCESSSSSSISSYAVVIGTSHLCFRELEARRHQAQQFLHQANHFRQEMTVNFPSLSKVAVSLSGDFNSGPASWVYNLFSSPSQGHMTSVYNRFDEITKRKKKTQNNGWKVKKKKGKGQKEVDVRDEEGEESEEEKEKENGGWKWNPEAEVNPSFGSKSFTCFIEKPSMIDYIWISTDLRCEEVLELPKKILLPNEHLSSDHIALFTKLSLISGDSG
jgi:mRNA deadenylase 3'-5' endonuclease subunit Ccr4